MLLGIFCLSEFPNSLHLALNQYDITYHITWYIQIDVYILCSVVFKL